jgi:hypothetical protein
LICADREQVPEQAIPLVAECLRLWTSPSPESKQIVQKAQRLIEDLDSDNFQKRKAAVEALGKMLSAESAGKGVVSTALQQALEKKPSLEVSKAIRKLLGGMDDKKKW